MTKCCSSSRILFILPLICCILFPITFAVTYGLSVVTGHTNRTDFPYISETGSKPPESCVFGQLLNIAAVVVGVTVYVRLMQVREALNCMLPSVHIQRLNYASFFIGELAAFGVSIVGNFQMDNILIVHMVGAGLTFILGAVYSWLQCVVSYHLLKLTCSRPMFWFRVVLAALTTLFLIGTLLGAMLYGQDSNTNPSLRLLSTSSEWIMALAMSVYFATFASEFRFVKVNKPRVTVKTTFVV